MRRLSRRPAFTLVELIVVIGIILVIAALGAAFIPSLSRSQRVATGANSIQGWLLGAKMRAKRDGLPTGLRFLYDPQNPTTVREMQLVQMPGPMTGGAAVFLSAAQLAAGKTPPPGYLPTQQTAAGATFMNGPQAVSYNSQTCVVTFGPANLQSGAPMVDFSDGKIPPDQWLVQPGDSISFFDGGVYRIAGVVPPAGPGQPAFQLQLQVDAYSQHLGVDTNGNPTGLGAGIPTSSYAIYRQPRMLIGEPPMNLPDGILIDLAQMQSLGINFLMPGAPGYDLVFLPSGAVKTGLVGRIPIWVRQEDTPPSPTDNDGQVLVMINIPTGAIGVYDVAVGANPFANAP